MCDYTVYFKSDGSANMPALIVGPNKSLLHEVEEFMGSGGPHGGVCDPRCGMPHRFPSLTMAIKFIDKQHDPKYASSIKVVI